MRGTTPEEMVPYLRDHEHAEWHALLAAYQEPDRVCGELVHKLDQFIESRHGHEPSVMRDWSTWKRLYWAHDAKRDAVLPEARRSIGELFTQALATVGTLIGRLTTWTHEKATASVAALTAA